MKKKIITTNDLAVMVAKGFAETAKKTDVARLDLKIDNLHTEMNERFEKVDARFDKIENLILAEHRRRIEKLESDMKELKNALAI